MVSSSVARAHRALTRLAAAAALSLAMATNVHAALAYSNMFIFGDSLSETGNYQALGVGALAYPGVSAPGRHSNGPVWVEYLGAQLGIGVDAWLSGGNNYAWGGARTEGQPGPFPPIDVGVQATIFLNEYESGADSDALYVVWGGGNDARDGLVANTADNLGQIIAALASVGARHFLVPNLPDVGPDFAQVNSDLVPVLDSLEATLPISLTRLDVASLFAAVIGDTVLNGGGVYGFSNVVDPCYDGSSVCATPDSYLLWDEIHPTTRMHEVIGNAAFAALTPVPVPAAVFLLTPSLLLLGRRRAA
ncbi:MAG: SGNH/GDSL hydrolase family protein [Gammaproteobacteria bacterium]